MLRAFPDLLSMSWHQCLVLDRMEDERGFPMADIAADVGIPLKECRSITRHFHALGLADFGVLYNEDEPKLAGRGYYLTGDGARLQRLMSGLIGYKPFLAAEEAAYRARAAQGQPS